MPIELRMSDFICLTELALQTLSIIKPYDGENARLTQEVERLHLTLQQLSFSISISEFLITNPDSNYSLELKAIWKGCQKILLRIILTEERILDINRIRSKLSQQTSAILLCLNLINAGSPGRIARRMNFQGREISMLRQSLNAIIAQLANQIEGSILSSNSSEGEEVIWEEIERRLVRKGYAITLVLENKKILMDYVRELGERGMLDDIVAVNPNSHFYSTSSQVLFDFGGMPTPRSWISNTLQFEPLPSSRSSTRSFSDLPLRNFDENSLRATKLQS